MISALRRVREHQTQGLPPQPNQEVAMAGNMVSPRPVRAALYARVSTNNGQNPEMQLGELRQYCQRRGLELYGEYVDAGISGAREHRPELDRLISDCRRRLVDAVVVYRYDRFARSLRQLVNALEEFRCLGIDFISLHEGIDTSTPQGKLVFGIFGSIAEFERELIRDRVKSGIAAARAKGKRLGRPRTVVDSDKITALRIQGISWATIGEQLGVSEGTARQRGQHFGNLIAAAPAISS